MKDKKSDTGSTALFNVVVYFEFLLSAFDINRKLIELNGSGVAVDVNLPLSGVKRC